MLAIRSGTRGKIRWRGFLSVRSQDQRSIWFSHDNEVGGEVALVQMQGHRLLGHRGMQPLDLHPGNDQGSRLLRLPGAARDARRQRTQRRLLGHLQICTM